MLLLAFDPIQLLTPDLGLVFWTLLGFLAFWFIMGKFAFKPIISAIQKREETINEALQSANKAKEEMKHMHADNERLLAEAKEERLKILKEAKDAKESIIQEAHTRANEEKTRILFEAKAEIDKQKNDAIASVKKEVGKLSVEIAEKILRKELDSAKGHESLIAGEIEKIKLN
jgi:F-type H+-transporting ATPase subunit b